MNLLLRSRRVWSASALVLGVGLGLMAVGCNDEKKVSAVEVDAGELGSQKSMLGGKLGDAVKAAESAQASPLGKQGSGDGPPDKGVFAPGAADKALAPGAPPKIDLISDGAEPRVNLAYAPPAGEQKKTVAVALRNQGRGLPIDYVLTLKVDKPKGSKKDDKKNDAAAPASFAVVAAITGIGLPPQVPKDTMDQLSKLKGSEIRYQFASSGAMTEPAITVAKGVDAGLQQALYQLLEGLSLMTPLLPSKPVGVGAYWMVADRLTSAVVEVVRYRVFRVEKVSNDEATLTVDVRQYATKADVDVSGGQRVSLIAFESSGKAKTEWTAAGLLPTRAEGSVRMLLDGRVANGQQAGLQAEIAVRITDSAPETLKK